MKFSFSVAALLIFLATAPQASAFPATTQVSLAGEWSWKPAELSPADAYQVSSSPENWSSMQVPSNWHLQGHELSGALWMRKTFSVSAQFERRTVELVFEGVDYSARVWLNGVYLGFHEGYFEPFRFDVSQALRFGSENQLIVRVDSPQEEFAQAWSLHKRLIKGIFNHHDTRPGGAWSERGQEQNTGGIWAPVFLRVTGGAFISELRFTASPASPEAESQDGRDWNADVEFTVDYPGRGSCPAVVEVSLAPGNFKPAGQSGGKGEETVLLLEGRNAIRVHLTVTNVQRWWSWDQGAQPLYKILVRVKEDARVIDEEQDQVGLRTVQMIPETKEWRLNGRRVFLRGTNYISTQWLSEMTAERYETDLALARRANVNAVRVHAHIEAPEFYRAADRAGILIWQDFPLQWGYAEDSVFESDAVNQALGMVTLLFNRPSVIAWSMHNEPPWDAPWMQYKYKDYDPQQNKRLDEKLYAAVRAYDRTRYTHLASETAEHPWLGWYSGSWEDYGKPTRQALITEYGAQALPPLPSLKKIVGETNLWPDSQEKWALWEFHNFQRHETFDLAKVPMGKRTEELIGNTQEYQARLIQFAAESYRRQRFQPVTAIFQFMFVEDWPSMNWGVLDYWRNEKPGYEALTKAYQPILPSIVWNRLDWTQGSDASFDLWAINDLPTAYARCRYLAALTRNGATVQQVELQISLDPDTGEKVGTLHQKNLAAGSYVLSTRIVTESGQTLGADSYSFRVQPTGRIPAKRAR